MFDRRSRRAMTRLDLAIWVIMVAACAAMIIWSWIRFAPVSGSGSAPQPNVDAGAALNVTAPHIVLTDQNGQPFDSDSLHGQVWLVDFIFTNCPGPCPMMTGNLRALQKAIGPREDVHFISVTCDPWRDDPATLKKYAETYGIDESQWTFLTGAFPVIQTYARQLYLTTVNPREAAESAAQHAPDSPESGAAADTGNIVHSTRIALIDRTGKVADWYIGTDAEEMQRLTADLRAMLDRDESSGSTGGGRYASALAMLPGVNASLNGAAAALLLVGLVLIRSGRRVAHMRIMIAAFLTSVAFLVCYLAYHTLRHVELGDASNRWQVESPIRWIYYGVLISHVILAAAVPFLAIRTLWLAVSGRFDAHRRLARITWPIWMYVSVTGVLVYWMLYHLQPMLERVVT